MTNEEAIEVIKKNYPPENYSRLREALDMALELLAADPTPVQPDTPKRGDKVRHKDHKHFGIGIVDDIAKSGLRAYCYFPDYDRRRSNWEPRAYYRLDKLEVIPNGD